MARKRRKRGPKSPVQHSPKGPVVLSYASQKPVFRRRKTMRVAGAVAGAVIAVGTPELTTRKALKISERLADRQIENLLERMKN